MPTPSRLRSRRLVYVLVLVFAALIASACSGGDSDEPKPSPTPTATPLFTIVAPPGPEPTPTPRAGEPPLATATPRPAPATEQQIRLEILSPRDGAGIEISAARVFGFTRPDAIVAINGTPVDVEADGSFHRDVPITPGGNLIEVVSTDISGATEFSQIAVFGVQPTAALPLSLFYPPDGLTVNDTHITVFGGTRQDAVVGVNGRIAEINRLGIFEARIPLDLGANLIEVVAADLDDNISFRTAVVFRSQ